LKHRLQRSSFNQIHCDLNPMALSRAVQACHRNSQGHARRFHARQKTPVVASGHNLSFIDSSSAPAKKALSIVARGSSHDEQGGGLMLERIVSNTRMNKQAEAEARDLLARHGLRAYGIARQLARSALPHYQPYRWRVTGAVGQALGIPESAVLLSRMPQFLSQAAE
jgi:hypothetical protein